MRNHISRASNQQITKNKIKNNQKISSQYMQGQQNILITSPKRLDLRDIFQLNKSPNFKLVDKLKNNGVHRKTHNKTKELLNKST